MFVSHIHFCVCSLQQFEADGVVAFGASGKLLILEQSYFVRKAMFAVDHPINGIYGKGIWCERGDSNPHGFTRQILSSQ